MVRLATHPEARRLFGVAIEGMEQLLAPHPDISLAEWAERNRILGDSSPEKGPYRFARAPYLREICEAFNDPTFREGIVLKAARVGYTEGVINSAVGYIIDQDPGNILTLWPTKEDAVQWSKETLPELIHLTAALQGKIADPDSRAPNTTILHRKFIGGWLTAVGSNSPAAVRRRNARYVFIDEYDVLDQRKNQKEGDIGQRAVRRAQNHTDAKIIKGGSPQAENSRVVRDYGTSDQREYYCRCPHCAHEQVPIWDNVRWEKETDAQGAVVAHRTDVASYACIECGVEIREGREKLRFITEGRWIARHPGRPIRGWKITALVSLFVSWATLAAEYVAAVDQLKAEGDPDLLIEWKQQVMAEPFEFRSQAGELVPLVSRRETYAAEVPLGVGVLVATVDVQHDRLELLIRGFGVGQESWDVAHHRIYGDPDERDVWDRLAALIWRPFQHESGAPIFVRAVGVDSGDTPERVYEWCRKHARLNAWPLKGMEMKRSQPLIMRSKSKGATARLFLIDDARFKRKVLRRLRIKEPGPGFMHFPVAGADGLDDEYLAQFENEREEPKGKDRDGNIVFKWKKTGPNEAIDLAKMALAVLHILGDAVVNNLPQLVQRVQAEGEARRATDLALAPAVHPALADPRRARRMGSQRGIEV